MAENIRHFKFNLPPDLQTVEVPCLPVPVDSSKVPQQPELSIQSSHSAGEKQPVPTLAESTSDVKMDTPPSCLTEPLPPRQTDEQEMPPAPELDLDSVVRVSFGEMFPDHPTPEPPNSALAFPPTSSTFLMSGGSRKRRRVSDPDSRGVDV